MALIAQFEEHSTGIEEVMGSNPAQSRNFFQVSVPVVLLLALALMTINCLDLRYKVNKVDGMASLELYVMKEFIHLLFLLIGTFR